MKSKIRAVAAVLILVFFISACGLGLKNGKLSIPISLNEQAITRLVEGVQGIILAASPVKPDVTINHIAFLEPDSIRVDGTYKTPDSDFIQGSMTIAFGVVNEQPRVQVTSLDIPGMEGLSSTMDDVNRALEEALQREVENVQEAAVFKSITVQDNELKMIVEVPLKKAP
ncbi:MAG: hypothetical protein ACYC3H_11455 [Bellilinea sp.]